MLVLCFEGCHGCGKTELCKQFQREGFWVLDEAFLNMEDYMLHPQSLLMETNWVVAWFLRLLKHAREVKTETGMEPILIADRSPFSAVFYGKHGHLLEPVIRKQLEEVFEASDIIVFTVHVSVERDILWERICRRLQREPARIKYKEDNREWMEATCDFYDTFEWSLRVCNTYTTIPELMETVIATVSDKLPRFKTAVNVLIK